MNETDGDLPGVSRRKVLAATGTASVFTVAGCSGGEGTDTEAPADDGGRGGTTESGGGDTAPTTTAMTSSASDYQVTTSSSVDQLSIVDSTPRIGYFGSSDQTYFPVEITVENSGEKETDLFKYEYEVTLKDANGADVTGNQGGSSSGENSTAAPGGQGSLIVYSTITVEPSEVAQYEVRLFCEGEPFPSEGVYCQ